MSNQNNQLINFSAQELEVKYRNTLVERYHTFQQEKIKLAYLQYPERNDFSHFLSIFDKNNSLARENARRTALMKVTTGEIFELALSSFQLQTQQLTSFATETIKNLIENNQVLINQNQQELTTIKTLMNEKDDLISELKNQIITSNQELKNTRELLVKIEQELAENSEQLKTEINWAEVRRQQRKSITSTEHYLKEQLETLKKNYAELTEENLSIEDKLALKRTELKEYIKLAEALAGKEIWLHKQVAELKNKEFSYSQKLLELENQRVLLVIKSEKEKNSKETLELKVNDLLKEKESWANQKAEAKESLRKWQELEAAKVAIFNRTALENAQLKSQIIDFKQTIAQRDQTIKEGLKYVHQLEAELANHQISLEIKDQNLKELAKLNFQSKLKLQSLLFLDSLRSFLPHPFSSSLTTIETSIFVSNVTNHPRIEKCSWFALALLLISSVLYSSYKIFKFSIFKGLDLIRWLRGKRVDWESLKEKEFQEWKNKWNVGKNYSFTELENIRKDKEVIEIEINDQFKTSNSKVDKLATKRKKVLK